MTSVYDDAASAGLSDRANTAKMTFGGTWNPPKSVFDLYTPRYVSGTGISKEGLCPICIDSGVKLWSKLKSSAHNYHMNNFHGISSNTCKPFPPPIGFRVQARTAASVQERDEIVQGNCGICKKWVDIEGIKRGAVKIPEIYWWKHAQQCHNKHPEKMQDPEGVFKEDALFKKVSAFVARHGDPY
ncbi:hypothetical protein K437DRAFT_269651 [Tilletiaria anomala UBC 951]|uniref:Transcription regulator Rua1 C-terminal domain-containing protein n=1 Tax=Tilletiaria anomala (strain ATCC 24038 / CBS 436.72 / UBC 951) TaxID=1037660 RepID=A0A066VS33_TILAU|nr:uncharacterized protein K437DRAFT_269651 [Tilletiaria anomala UBC 951]KDN41619.1 hypothetical protein K437DRAFT_269651 [Tilletiaria anomala UBC 951]